MSKTSPEIDTMSSIRRMSPFSSLIVRSYSLKDFIMPVTVSYFPPLFLLSGIKGKRIGTLKTKDYASKKNDYRTREESGYQPLFQLSQDWKRKRHEKAVLRL